MAPAHRSPWTWLVLALPVVAALLFHLGLATIVVQGIQERWWLMALLVLGFSITLAWSAVASTLVVDRWVPWAVGGAVAATSLVVGFNPPTLLALLIEFIAIGTFARNARIEALNRLKFSVWKAMSFGITTSITLLLLAVSAFSYHGFTRPGADERLKGALIDAAVTALNPVLPKVVSNYRPDATVDELIRSTLPSGQSILETAQQNAGELSRPAVEQALQNRGIDPRLVDLNRFVAQSQASQEELARQIDAQVQKLSDELVVTTRTELSKALGVELRADQRGDEAIRAALTVRYDHALAPMASLLPFIFAGSLFFTLVIFTPVYLYLTWFLGAALFWILRAFHLVLPEEHQATVQTFHLRGER
ncbi:MAG: hypothetical protein HY567_03915 [Candidatus Kerfeldbacteria bacterium]|nr:hypothetical protein [Candidatus Kerfeldbacteria bacterium]